jgi:hypothetical protein
MQWRNLKGLFKILLLLLISTNELHAQTKSEEKKLCRCKKFDSVITAFQLATNVFTGKVIKISKIEPKGREKLDSEVKKITFDIYQVWKGPLERQLSLVRVNVILAECSYQFEEGEEYLVYADKNSSDVYRYRYVQTGKDILDATTCSRTNKLIDAEGDLDILGPGKIPQ